MKINYDLAQAFPVVPVAWIAINVDIVDNYYGTIKQEGRKKESRTAQVLK